MHKKENRPDRLYTLAERQGGYFTSADASALGYTTAHQYFHVKRGNWVRVDRGIYRSKRFPSTAQQDLIPWWLCGRNARPISFYVWQRFCCSVRAYCDARVHYE